MLFCMESSGLTLDSCFSRIAGVTALREGFERFEREGAPIFDLLDPEGFGVGRVRARTRREARGSGAS